MSLKHNKSGGEAVQLQLQVGALQAQVEDVQETGEEKPPQTSLMMMMMRRRRMRRGLGITAHIKADDLFSNEVNLSFSQLNRNNMRGTKAEIFHPDFLKL